MCNLHIANGGKMCYNIDTGKEGTVQCTTKPQYFGNDVSKAKERGSEKNRGRGSCDGGAQKNATQM